MKKLLPILAIITLASCQKKTCWKCTFTTSYQGTTNVPSGSASTEQVCDKTKSEIREFEKTATKSVQSGGILVRTGATCVEN